MKCFFLNLEMERAWQKDYANHSEAMTDVADYIAGFYNSKRLIPNWATCHPTLFSVNRQLNYLLMYTKLLDHHTAYRAFFPYGGSITVSGLIRPSGILTDLPHLCGGSILRGVQQ